MQINFFIKTSILLIAVLINLLLSLSVFRNSRKSATNRVYALLGLVIVFWMTANYLSILPGLLGQSLILIRLSLFFAVAMSALFLLLTYTMPSERLLISRRRLKIFGFITLLAMAVTISPLAFTKVNIVDSSPQPVAGPGIGLFTLVSTAYSLMAIYILLKKLRRSSGIERVQFRFVLLGITLMLGSIITTVLVPVVLFKINIFVAFIPLYTLFFLGLTAVAIIRHRLFDIRTVIARSVAYFLVVTSFVTLYSGAVFVISYFFFKDSQINTSRHITYILLALVFTPTIYWLKKQFDRVTNRLFFKDSYDPQEVLNKLSGAIVAEIDLHRILSAARSILTDTIKSSFVEFVLVEDNHPKLEVSKDFATQERLTEISKHMQEQSKEILITEQLSSRHSLKNDLFNDGVAISLRLKTQHQVVGYVLFGEKQSGDAYSNQDESLLNIVANELAVAIQNAMRFEEIKQFNLTLQQKVDMATKQLRVTNEKLREIDATKDEFISMASHQLRTPLTSVKGYMSMVLEGDAGKISAQQRKLLQQSFISSQRMVYLIADLLNISRLKTGKFVIEAVPSNLADVVQGEVQQLVETAQSRNLELKYNKPKSFPTLMLDETKIRQVIMNFIDNSIYYTPSGGHITINLLEKPDTVEFTVVDDGLGVPKNEQHHLFAKFYRAGNAKKARPDGTGLGLFMAKKVIVAQGGAIIFSSEEGKGSTFGFSFEKAKLHATAKAVAKASKELIVT